MKNRLLVVFLLFVLISCNAPDKPLPDNEENRLSMAKVVLEAYPTSSYATAIRKRITQLTGKEVEREARELIQQTLNPDELEKKRLDLLVNNFSASELKLMAEVASSNTGRSLLEKIPAFEQDVVDFIVPFVMEALSNNSGVNE